MNDNNYLLVTMSSPASDKKFTTEGESESSLIRMLEELPEHVGSSAAGAIMAYCQESKEIEVDL